MPISQNAVWEIRTTGSNTNGGFFVTGASGTDFSQQASAQYALTGVTSAGAGNVVLHASAAANMVGNGAYLVSGTNGTVGRFEITAVTPGVDITLSTNKAGASIATGALADGVLNIGGACKIADTLDDDIFEDAPNTGGNIYYIKAGTYTAGEAIAVSATGGAQKPHQIIGYNATRGDNPTGSTRPVIAMAANTCAWGAQWVLKYLSFTTTAANGLNASGNNQQYWHVKVVNNSTTANRNAFTNSGSDIFTLNCEFISYRGNALSITNTAVGGSHLGLICRASNKGVTDANASGAGPDICKSIFAGCVTTAIELSAGRTSEFLLDRCTLYGRASKLGTGISIATGSTDIRILNTIITGFVTGVSHADTQSIGIDEYNNYYNNTTDVTNWTKGATTIGLDPAISGVTEVTVTTGTTSGATLTKAGATFQTSGVTAGRDYVYISAGAGVTAGIYGITSVDSETQLTLDINPGNSAGDVTASINVGQNFAPGTNMQRVGYPSSFPGGYSTSYTDIGAIHANYSAWWSLPAVGDIKLGVTARDNSLTNNVTGTGANIASGGVILRRR